MPDLGSPAVASRSRRGRTPHRVCVPLAPADKVTSATNPTFAVNFDCAYILGGGTVGEVFEPNLDLGLHFLIYLASIRLKKVKSECCKLTPHARVTEARRAVSFRVFL